MNVFLRPLMVVAISLASLTLSAQKNFSNEKIWFSQTFATDYVDGFNSMNDGVHFTRLEMDRGGPAIAKYDFKTNEKVGTILNTTELSDGAGDRVAIDAYSFSADETQLLVSSNTEPIYRHSTKGTYYIVDIASKKVKPLSKVAGKQRLAEFSPDGKKVAFVRDNDLFVTTLADGKEVQVTSDGKWNHIINGATDWVYEEEFSFDKGFQWSPDSRYVAFYKFDESRVKEFQMAMYGSLYPDQYSFKYPKAGETNSTISIHVHDALEGKTRMVNTGSEADQYIPRIKWANASSLVILRMNRHQSVLEFLNANVEAKSMIIPTTAFFTEKSTTYVEVTDDWQFIDGGKSFLWASEMSGYNHLWKIGMDGSKTQITTGDWDVTALCGVNEKKGLIYFQSAEAGATQRQIYQIKLNGSGKKTLTTRKGQNRAVFSKNMAYFVNYHSDANTPYHISVRDSKGKEVKVLVDNQQLINRLKEYNAQPKAFFEITTSEDIKLNAWMIKPPNFDPNKKYPVFMTVYNGPGINTVNDSYGAHNYLWHQLIAQEGYIVVSVDGRGTGYRGAEFKKCTYQQLGKYETIDQIEAAKWLAKQSYVDGDRIGIQGWSYGGYMSALCLSKGADVFKMAIAVAPVTNWRYYDTIYTERYMRTPQENASGYDDNSPINHINKIKGPFLIVHGSADDNVHYQNTMEMVDKMQAENIPFEMAIYPNKNHGIYGGKTRLHLFTKMTEFIQDNL